MMQRAVIVFSSLFVASVWSVCESDDCPVAEWKYRGKLQRGCANPGGWSGGFWCATKVDKGQNYIGKYKKCTCKEPPGCDSEQCPIKSWKYTGEEQHACSDPYGYSGGSWCPTSKSSLDESGNWQSGDWTLCQCTSSTPPTTTPPTTDSKGDCDSDECDVKHWIYYGDKRFACANTGWSKGPRCPTPKGVDANGNYIKKGYTRCKCGGKKPPLIKLPDGSECRYPFGHTMNKYSYPSKDEACASNIIERGFTQAGKDLIVKTHNELRQKVASGNETIGNQPPATNMRKMKWNEELAMIAQRFADQCIFGHDKNRNICKGSYVGQNGFIDYTRKKTLEELNASVDKAVKLWYDEVKKMDPSNLKPSVIRAKYGHYTQVVWADTYEVGCGIVHMNPKTIWLQV